MCDTEHMFDCPSPKESNSELDLTQNDFLGINEMQPEAHEESLARLAHLAQSIAADTNAGAAKLEVNPFLQGEKLPIAAKKGHHAHSDAVAA